MQIEPLDRGLAIRTPAKLNLFLEVLGKRADGYHQIDTIMCPVALFDRLRIEPHDSNRIELSIRRRVASSALAADRTDLQADDPAWDIPTDRSNLVVRALEAVRSALGHAGGCRVELDKHIPAAAGLGGGSSDAAAAIVAGLALWSKWDRALAGSIGAMLGSDIPLFFGDEQNGIGLARATGRGEHVEILSGRPPLCFVISHPPVGSSTAEVYKLWRGGTGHRTSEGMLAACAKARERAGHDRAAHDKAAHDIEELLFNALQPAASQLNDWIARQLQCFAELGQPKALMSGSGSACFTLVEDPDQGQKLVEDLIAFGLPRAYVARAWYAPPIEQQLDRIA